MGLFKSKTVAPVPQAIAEFRPGQKALAWAEVEKPHGALAVYARELVVAGEECRAWEWVDIEKASWDDDTRVLTITFVNSAQAPLVMTVAEEGFEAAVSLVRERIEASIIYYEYRLLSTGVHARGLVRRRWQSDELFTQVIVDGDVTTPRDYERLQELEESMREVVGMPAGRVVIPEI